MFFFLITKPRYMETYVMLSNEFSRFNTTCAIYGKVKMSSYKVDTVPYNGTNATTNEEIKSGYTSSSV